MKNRTFEQEHASKFKEFFNLFIEIIKCSHYCKKVENSYLKREGESFKCYGCYNVSLYCFNLIFFINMKLKGK